MRVAFYAPLKPPDHPVPSGDRSIARSLMRALALAGHDVQLASRLRSFDARGDRERQLRLGRIGARLAARLAVRWRDARPDVWFTYHVHHKAPDLLGPAVSRALAIPYLVAEASVAPRQRDGPWAEGYAQARTAIVAADVVLFVNPADVLRVQEARGAHARSAMLAPFIDAAAFADGAAPVRPVPRGRAQLVTIGMMRDGAKLASYRALAAALALLVDIAWELRIVGDGPARAAVEAAFAPLGDRVRFAGALPSPDVAALLRASDVFVWPAIDEAMGIVFLEAQACALPVVGAQTPGVAALVSGGRTGLLVPPGDVGAFAAAVRRLLHDPALRARMGRDALAHVRERHDLPVAALRLDAILRDAVASRGGARTA